MPRAPKDVIDKRKHDGRVQYLVQFSSGNDKWVYFADANAAMKRLFQEFNDAQRAGRSPSRARGRSATPSRGGRGRSATPRRAPAKVESSESEGESEEEDVAASDSDSDSKPAVGTAQPHKYVPTRKPYQKASDVDDDVPLSPLMLRVHFGLGVIVAGSMLYKLYVR